MTRQRERRRTDDDETVKSDDESGKGSNVRNAGDTSFRSQQLERHRKDIWKLTSKEYGHVNEIGS